MGLKIRVREYGADEAGMSVVEVLIASAILIIAVVAILALLFTSLGMGTQARAQSLAVNTANSFIEDVRALGYADITQTRLDQMASSASGSIGGMQVSIATTVTPYFMTGQPTSGPPAYKKIDVRISITGQGLKTYTMATGTFVRDWKSTGTASGATETPEPVDPLVDWDTITPAAGSPARPVWSVQHIGAIASSGMPGVSLVAMFINWQGSELASCTPDAETGNLTTYWDTSLVPEGRTGTMEATAWDALMNHATVQRTFVVDNYRPPTPSGITLSSTTPNTSSLWTWNQVMDGETAVPDYLLRWYRQGSAGTWTGTEQTVTGTSASLGTDPFSRYYPELVARGPRAASSPADATWVSAPVQGSPIISQPSFSAMTVVVAQQNANKPFYFTPSTLTLTSPTFKHASPSYRWEYRVSSGAWTAFSTGNPTTVPTAAFAKVTGPASGLQTSLSFRCTATVTPDGGAATVVKSPIMTVTNPRGGNTYNLASFATDWTAW